MRPKPYYKTVWHWLMCKGFNPTKLNLIWYDMIIKYVASFMQIKEIRWGTTWRDYWPIFIPVTLNMILLSFVFKRDVDIINISLYVKDQLPMSGHWRVILLTGEKMRLEKLPVLLKGGNNENSCFMIISSSLTLFDLRRGTFWADNWRNMRLKNSSRELWNYNSCLWTLGDWLILRLVGTWTYHDAPHISWSVYGSI